MAISTARKKMSIEFCPKCEAKLCRLKPSGRLICLSCKWTTQPVSDNAEVENEPAQNYSESNYTYQENNQLNSSPTIKKTNAKNQNINNILERIVTIIITIFITVIIMKFRPQSKRIQVNNQPNINQTSINEKSSDSFNKNNSQSEIEKVPQGQKDKLK